MPRNFITPDLDKITVKRHYAVNSKTGVNQDLRQLQIWAPDVDPNSKTGPYILGYVGLEPDATVTLVVHCTEESEKQKINEAVAAFKGGKPTKVAQIPYPDDPDEEPDDDDEDVTEDDDEEK